MFSQEIKSSTPNDPDRELIEALERCQNEVLESRRRIELFEKRESALSAQVATEKKNGNLTSSAYRTAVTELTEVRAALDAAKAELKLREAKEKELRKKIKSLKGQLWFTRIAAGGSIALILFLLL